jgi:hypothetical protein
MGIVSIVPGETLPAVFFRYAALQEITSGW